MDIKALAFKAEQIAKEAGELILSIEQPRVYSKEGQANFVTQADISSQEYIVKELSPLIPGARFFAEEQEKNSIEPGYNWVIDPIDGTLNFMHGCNHSAVSIALVKDGAGCLGVVHDFYKDETFVGIRGEGAFLNGEPIHCADTPMESSVIAFGTSPYYRENADSTFEVIKRIFKACGDVRIFGSAALHICYVACGRFDGFYEGILSPWDYAAASVIVEEAGGKIVTREERPVSFDRGQLILASSQRVYPELVKLAEPDTK